VIRAAREAPGCEDFHLSPDPLEPGRINVYERWSTDADLERFRGEGPSDDQTSQIRSADVKRYRISSTEDP
jgi:quinol monooxygenase YgiN